MENKTILVSGSNGQLGHALQVLSSSTNYHFVFLTRDELNLADPLSIAKVFETYRPVYFVNCAAYTAVDKAENDQQTAYTVNSEAVGEIARQCAAFNTRLIHVSTDYVFNGRGEKPYVEDEKTDPVNYYGYTKWMGEKLALENNPATAVIRTSWVYSYHGNNFVKTMLRLMKERSEIRVVSDQVGSPTYALDLAEAIIRIIGSAEDNAAGFVPGIYHFSNQGIISWYDFACAIRDAAGLTCRVQPISTEEYPTPARRPGYSAMSITRISNTYGIPLKDWKLRLTECLKHL